MGVANNKMDKTGGSPLSIIHAEQPLIPSTNSESQRKPRHERRSGLEVSRQEIHHPFPDRPYGWWFLVSQHVCRIKQVLESRCHARPVHLDERHGTEILGERCGSVEMTELGWGSTYLENDK